MYEKINNILGKTINYNFKIINELINKRKKYFK